MNKSLIKSTEYPFAIALKSKNMSLFDLTISLLLLRVTLPNPTIFFKLSIL